MANLKSWYKLVTPREDLREGKPLDASEFADFQINILVLLGSVVNFLVGCGGWVGFGRGRRSWGFEKYC